MFFWLTAILTFLLLPFALIIGKPTKLTTVKALTPKDFHSRFKLSRLTPVVWIEPWSWVSKKMKGRANAFAFLGMIVMNNDHPDVVFHECIHVAHQSVFSPILYGLVYALDLLMYFPFRHWFRDRAYMRIPVGETVAYRIANKSKHLAP